MTTGVCMTNDAETEEQVEHLFDYLSALAQEVQEVYAKPVRHLGQAFGRQRSQGA
ncbi:hypothetical protein LO762_14950 [Actinocorallia sp. API 0066]|uniref:hypothetical protein n=1 Tax=Actinocorallia sp. API 0066 TaxID=2896846 RepID=UPI001E3F5773|nr:hypothetical protein [Actinocorallia sp. API 0066]MCD0450477.1 hypothetical protein [Actinocorallia sp. API 0066]